MVDEAAQQLEFTSPPLPQVGVVPGTAAVVSTGEEVNIAKLGPDEDVPLFSVRMAMPIPPDSEADGTASVRMFDCSLHALLVRR